MPTCGNHAIQGSIFSPSLISSRNLTTAWAYELLALCISSISLCSISLLLSQYNGAPVVQWHRVTLKRGHFLCSQLLCEECLLLSAGLLPRPNSSGYGSTRKPQSLPDFELINDAAKGASGSVSVCFFKSLLMGSGFEKAYQTMRSLLGVLNHYARSDARPLRSTDYQYWRACELFGK